MQDTHNKFWIGNADGQILLKDNLGNQLHDVRTEGSSMTGFFSVTDGGDLFNLLYIEKSDRSIRLYTSGRRTMTVVTI
jgi:hypothetical protein